ncbi:MAG: histidinol-phosphate transaminase [Dehalococcoidia bacterium]|nr:histidinol-phosphate transaminase [Dehalococcoidia bacterium]
MPRFDAREALRLSMRELPVYEALEDPVAIAAQYGVPAERVVKLDGNENPYGPSPRAIEALRGDYAPHRYVDPTQARLREAIAGRLGVGAESVVAGAGSDEIIDLLSRLFVSEGDRVVVATPTFGMYAFDASLSGADLVDVPRAADWSLDAESLIEAAHGAKAVFLPSPNNPTGNAVPAGLVDRLLASGALVVIDEAYIEFSHAESLAGRAASDASLVVLRTFSKWGGLAGLRLGYGVMAPGTADLLLRAKQPYNVSAAAEAAALATLQDTEALDERACRIAGDRDRLAERLEALGWVYPWPSEANFLLCGLALGTGLEVRDELRRRGIFVRYFTAPRLADHVRISIGTPEQNDRVVEAMRGIGEALASAVAGSGSGSGKEAAK